MQEDLKRTASTNKRKKMFGDTIQAPNIQHVHTLDCCGRVGVHKKYKITTQHLQTRRLIRLDTRHVSNTGEVRLDPRQVGG